MVCFFDAEVAQDDDRDRFGNFEVGAFAVESASTAIAEFVHFCYRLLSFELVEDE